MTKLIKISDALTNLTGWSAAQDKEAIEKTFRFSDFKNAWAFMSSAALKAEQMDHHPEWFNVYGTVKVTMTTHDAKGVTALDVEMARFMNEMAEKLGGNV